MDGGALPTPILTFENYSVILFTATYLPRKKSRASQDVDWISSNAGSQCLSRNFHESKFVDALKHMITLCELIRCRKQLTSRFPSRLQKAVKWHMLKWASRLFRGKSAPLSASLTPSAMENYTSFEHSWSSAFVEICDISVVYYEIFDISMYMYRFLGRVEMSLW